MIKEKKMRKWMGSGPILLFFIVFGWAAIAIATEVPDAKVCDTGTEEARSKRNNKANVKQDDRNLCLALNPIKNPEDRYKHKDHSTYYCSLIRNRDKMNYCNALVQGEPRHCENVIDAKLEKKCLAESK